MWYNWHRMHIFRYISLSLDKWCTHITILMRRQNILIIPKSSLVSLSEEFLSHQPVSSSPQDNCCSDFYYCTLDFLLLELHMYVSGFFFPPWKSTRNRETSRNLVEQSTSDPYPCIGTTPPRSVVAGSTNSINIAEAGQGPISTGPTLSGVGGSSASTQHQLAW